MDVDDRCGPPYTVVFDDDYEELCPWANVVSSGKVWPDELTDAAVELFESEKTTVSSVEKNVKNGNLRIEVRGMIIFQFNVLKGGADKNSARIVYDFLINLDFSRC